MSPSLKIKLQGKLLTLEKVQDLMPNGKNLMQDAWCYLETEQRIRRLLDKGEGVLCAAFLNANKEELKVASANTIRLSR